MSSPTKSKDLAELCRVLGYAFQDSNLLEEAFRHSSYVNEHGNTDLNDNERLEFLGDAVLDLAISHILMALFREATEGDLSKYRASVVNEKGLCQIAKKLELGHYLLLGRGEDNSNGREKSSILADTMEALIGAIYLDAGFPASKEIIHRLFAPLLKRVASKINADDYKSLLQEHTQDVYKTRPKYQLLKESGPAHEKIFKVSIGIGGEIIAEGEGKSKKEAEQKAAREAYYCLQEEREDL